ncbi:MAG TPA: hypothetical protein VEX37_02280 [Thermomicrobiales bacterium]|nr:hypothetical protein [Thermomicrobiales bacterium]
METAATIEGIRRYSIHGEPYAVVYFSRNDDRDTIQHAQLSADALPDSLRVGDAIVITYVGSIVAGIRRAQPPPPDNDQDTTPRGQV